MITICMKCKKTHKFVKIVLVLFGKELYLCSRGYKWIDTQNKESASMIHMKTKAD